MRKRYDEGGDVMEAANASAESQDIANSMGAGPKNMEAPKAAPKPRVVSKKELEDSGMSLRDYLNRERGLTRRKEKDPTAGEARDKAAQEAADAIDPGRPEIEKFKPRYNPAGQAPKQTTQKPAPKVFMPSRPDNSFVGSKFKSGGSVSSASRRADGIATKGKTKGTMVAMCGGGMYKK
jgi:hypothetical protein